MGLLFSNNRIYCISFVFGEQWLPRDWQFSGIVIIYCMSFVYEEQWGNVFQRGVGGLDRLLVPRCRRSVNVVILNGDDVVETYLNGGGGYSMTGSCPDGR